MCRQVDGVLLQAEASLHEFSLGPHGYDCVRRGSHLNFVFEVYAHLRVICSVYMHTNGVCRKRVRALLLKKKSSNEREGAPGAPGGG